MYRRSSSLIFYFQFIHFCIYLLFLLQYSEASRWKAHPSSKDIDTYSLALPRYFKIICEDSGDKLHKFNKDSVYESWYWFNFLKPVVLWISWWLYTCYSNKWNNRWHIFVSSDNPSLFSSSRLFLSPFSLYI